MLIISECGKVLKWVLGVGAAVADGGWRGVLGRAGEVVRSISVLGLVSVGGCGDGVVGSGMVGRVVTCIWGCIGMAVAVVGLVGVVQRGGVRAVLSELGRAWGEGGGW